MIRQIDWATRAGFNTLRLAVPWHQFFVGERLYEISDEAMNGVRRAVDAIRGGGMLAILDQHGVKLNMDATDDNLRMIEMVWRQVGAALCDIPENELWFHGLNDYTNAAQHWLYSRPQIDSIIAGATDEGRRGKSKTEIVSEYHSAELLRQGVDLFRKNSDARDPRTAATIRGLRGMYRATLDGIRAKNRERPVILTQSPLLLGDRVPLYEIPEEDDRLLFFFTLYRPQRVAHQGMPVQRTRLSLNDNEFIPMDARFTDTSTERRVVRTHIQAFAAQAKELHRPVIISEYGCSKWTRTRDRAALLRAVREEAERADVGWLMWDLCSAYGIAEWNTSRYWDPCALAAILPDSPLLPKGKALERAIERTVVRNRAMRTARAFRMAVSPLIGAVRARFKRS